MAETVIYTRASRAAVRAAVLSLPAAARAGGAADPMLAATGRVLLTRIREAFLVKMRGGMDEAGDRWEKLKPRTVRRKMAKRSVGGMERPVDIMRDDGPLLLSLTPDSGSDHQVFRVGPGQVEVGTNRQGAAAHHRGAPSRNLPQRRLWPAPSRWPTSWRRDILKVIAGGVRDLLVSILNGVSP